MRARTCQARAHTQQNKSRRKASHSGDRCRLRRHSVPRNETLRREELLSVAYLFNRVYTGGAGETLLLSI